jgi:glutamine synthetase adenylyltransferase
MEEINPEELRKQKQFFLAMLEELINDKSGSEEWKRIMKQEPDEDDKELAKMGLQIESFMTELLKKAYKDMKNSKEGHYDAASARYMLAQYLNTFLDLFVKGYNSGEPVSKFLFDTMFSHKLDENDPRYI